jgi:hypothetical protein
MAAITRHVVGRLNGLASRGAGRHRLTGNHSLNQRHGRGRVGTLGRLCAVLGALCGPMYRYLVAWNIRNGSVYQGEWDNHGRRHAGSAYFAGSSTRRGTVVLVVANVVLRMVLRRIKIEVMITSQATAAALATRANFAQRFHGYGTMV